MTVKMAAMLAALEAGPLRVGDLRRALEKRCGGSVTASGAYHRLRTLTRNGMAAPGEGGYRITVVGRAALDEWRQAIRENGSAA